VQGLSTAERTSPEGVLDRYREKLKSEGVTPSEIDRRVTLIQTKRQALENDFWNRFFTIEKPTFNTEPNAFLVSVVEGRAPGRALDVGMGEGRNALYLAKLGWDLTSAASPQQHVSAVSHSRIHYLERTDAKRSQADACCCDGSREQRFLQR
jgi:Tellurite resistance protein TehB